MFRGETPTTGHWKSAQRIEITQKRRPGAPGPLVCESIGYGAGGAAWASTI
jgi:hypothetical protein